MPSVRVRENEPFEVALRRFKRPLPGWYDTHAARSGQWSAPTFTEGA